MRLFSKPYLPLDSIFYPIEDSNAVLVLATMHTSRTTNIIKSMFGRAICFTSQLVDYPLVLEEDVTRNKLDGDTLFTSFWIKHEYLKE